MQAQSARLAPATYGLKISPELMTTDTIEEIVVQVCRLQSNVDP